MNAMRHMILFLKGESPLGRINISLLNIEEAVETVMTKHSVMVKNSGGGIASQLKIESKNTFASISIVGLAMIIYTAMFRTQNEIK